MRKIYLTYNPDDQKYYLEAAVTVKNQLQLTRSLGLVDGYSNFSEATAAFRAAIEFSQARERSKNEN